MNQRNVDIPVSSDRRKKAEDQLFRNALSGRARHLLGTNIWDPALGLSSEVAEFQAAMSDRFDVERTSTGFGEEETWQQEFPGGGRPIGAARVPVAPAVPVTQPGEIGLTEKQFETMSAGQMPEELKDLSPETVFKQTAQGVHPGYGLVATGGTGPRVKPVLQGTAYGVMQTADILFEPLDVATETAAELTGETAKKGFCLLYTSPSPRDRQKSRMPSSA